MEASELANMRVGSNRVMGRTSGPSTRRPVLPPRCADCGAPALSATNRP